MSSSIEHHSSTSPDGADLGPLLQDLKNLPKLQAHPDLVKTVFQRINTGAEVDSPWWKKLLSSEGLFRGSRLTILSGSLAIVAIVVIGFRMLQSPELQKELPAPVVLPSPGLTPDTELGKRDAAPARNTAERRAEEIRTSLESNTSAPAAVEGDIRENRGGLRSQDVPPDDRVDRSTLAAPGRDKERQGAATHEVKDEVTKKTDSMEHDNALQKGVEKETPVGGAVQFQNEYAPSERQSTIRAKSAAHSADSNSVQDSAKSIPAKNAPTKPGR